MKFWEKIKELWSNIYSSIVLANKNNPEGAAVVMIALFVLALIQLAIIVIF